MPTSFGGTRRGLLKNFHEDKHRRMIRTTICRRGMLEHVMAQEKPNRLAEWVVLLRRQWPVVQRHGAEWLDACREDPRLIWQTAVIRYGVYGLGLLIGIWLLITVAHSIAPPLPVSATPEATTADFHVVCTDPNCGYHFVIHRPFGFSKFPVDCPRCERKTGEQARPCNSKTCQGRWIAPVDVDGKLTCPHCGAEIE